MPHLIEVAFRGNRKEFFRWTAESPPPLKAAVIVEADRGEDLGHVHSTGDLAEVRCRGCPHGCGTAPPERLALREATAEESRRFRELAAENEDARRRAMERVKANGLVMKLTDAEWQWDRKKLTFYFTADRRVDFRTLVRDLAAMFRTRIELKQIGVRDEAKRLSGIGRCGREYCSASWLPDLRPVNLAVAKDQKLSLNPSQISGACGRLMCCLRYEHEFYVQSRRRFPKEGRILRTSLGEEKVVSCDIFHERVTLRTAEGDTRIVPLAELRAELESHGEALPQERVVEREITEDTSDDVILTDTEEYAVARLTMRQSIAQPPGGAPPASPASRGGPSQTSSSAGKPPVQNALPATARGAQATNAPSRVAAQPPASAVPDASAPAAASTGVSADGTITPIEGATTGEGETRRKRRRGRRGGRRLRAAEGRLDAANASQGNSGQTDDGADADDQDDPDDGRVDGDNETDGGPGRRDSDDTSAS